MINQRSLRTSILLLLTSFVAGTLAATYRVTDYGAKGDGITNDTEAFTNAWRAVCLNSTAASILHIPGGKVYLLGLTKFRGPCNHYVRVQVDGNLKRVDEVWSDDDNNWLLFINVNGITVAGAGEIDGQGASWWACKEAKARRKLARYLSIYQTFPKKFCINYLKNILTLRICSLADVRISRCKCKSINARFFKNSAMMHVAVGMSVGVRISNLKITAPAESPNTDGIHVERSRHVIISDCQISTGKSSDLVTLGIEKSYATAEGIHVSDSTIVRTDNGVRIKTWQGATGFARDISFRNISLTEVRNPIIIDQFYCPRGGCKNETSAVQVSNVKFIGVKGTSANDMAIRLECSQSSGCHDVVMEDVDIRNAVPGEQAQAFCFNAHGKKAKVVKPDVPCLSY
ncbi:hypothetical protein ZIOFF_027644 [Zingiber officinale]|uniref:Polygalacturonase n=1 Tax=Zingiber officinale TaxID=94328 RepID=A0A8J5GYU8_ZINOF|nr:hypothetical protein ZIOFF_027644 [Zingiber officinale]